MGNEGKNKKKRKKNENRDKIDKERKKEAKRFKGPFLYAPLCGSIVRLRRINHGESPPPFAVLPIAALRLQLHEWSN